MAVRIVTDSTCDLPDDIVAEYGITVLPLYINFGTESYLDGVDLSRTDFYARLPDADPPPTTAMPGPQAFLEIYQRLADGGATEIVSIHVSGTLSGTVGNARLAARESPIPVTVYDSGSLTLGMGFMVWEAAQMAAEGCSRDRILAHLAGLRPRTHVFAALDTLEYLRRSGRMSHVVATVGTWLRLKPLLKMNDGVSAAEKVRTTEGATQRLVALLEAQMPLEKVALVHTHALDRARLLRGRVRYLLSGIEALSVDITPVLGTHLGPGAAGFACISAKR